MKLVICNSLPTSRLFGDKIDPWWYVNNGVDVQFWDLSQLFLGKEQIKSYYGGAADYRFHGPNHKTYRSFKILKRDIFSHANWVFWHVSRFDRMHNDDWLIKCFNEAGIKYVFQHFDPTSSCANEKIRNLLRAVKSKWHRRICKPTAVVTSGYVGREQVMKYYPDSLVISVPSIKVLWEENAKPFIEEDPYVLFVDESVAYDPDAEMQNTILCDDIDGYYRRMRELFDRVETVLGINVQIACSGKFYYTDPNKFFGDRRVIYGETLELLQRCEFVLGHLSLALDQAVISRKPLLIVDDIAFTSYRRRGFRDVVKRFNIQPVINQNVDRQSIVNAYERDLGFYNEVEQNWFCEPSIKGDMRRICLENFMKL